MNYMKAPVNVRADWTVYEGLGEPVADVHGTENLARLMAAAPDLLEALQALCSSPLHSVAARTELWTEARAAIARATSKD
jgi:hypothetical protein